jgi:hypothetical protein
MLRVDYCRSKGQAKKQSRVGVMEGWSASGRERWSVDGLDMTKTMPKRDAKLRTEHPCDLTRPPISASPATNALRTTGSWAAVTVLCMRLKHGTTNR